MTRCEHGELWAACRACPPWDGWPDLGEYDLTEGAVAATGAWLTALVLTLAALAAVLLARRITR